MTKLFGLPMSTLAVIMAVLFAICLLSVFVIWLSNRTMFRLGLRNVPRRGAQSLLIVLGLMLGTLIITASFATGDSLAYSITNGSYQLLHRIDLLINFQGTDSTEGVTQVYVPQSDVATLQQQFANSPTIQNFVGFDFESLPVLNQRTNLSKPNVMLAGANPQELASVGGLKLQGGGNADLSQLTGNNVFVSKMTADKLDVKNGDTLTVFVNGKQQNLHVAGIVQNEGAAGDIGNGGVNDAGGISVPLALVQQLTGHTGQVNLVAVTLKGTERSTLKLADPAADELNSYFKSGQAQQALGLGSTVPQAYKVKQDNVNSADLFGNLITTVFLVLGLFSIAAGVLLIFMIFVMLAAERKAEMGMARAVGAQRINLVQAFVAEGMAYDVLAGFVGAALGVGAAFALVVLGLKLVLGSQGDFFSAHVTGTSLIVSYCLGAVVTFITIVISSFRVSRLNIVAAIRGTDEDETRAPRGHFSIWWFLLGVVLSILVLPLGLIVLLRKGFGLPWFWVFVPIGVVISLLFLPIAHNTGQSFFLSTAVSLLILCGGGIARRFGARSRTVWTIAGLLLLFYWLTPIEFGPLLVGKKMTGGIEMFVLSGIMIVAAFALVIVFNANLLTKLFVGGGEAGAYRIPAVMALLAIISVVVGVALGDNGGGLGQLLYLLAALFVVVMLITLAAARYPRLAPALKMAIAYPVANRFRTGMTIAMFSLIIFSLTVMSVLNSNFANLLLGNDAHGSWDVIATVNKNNPIANLVQTLQGTGKVDTSKIVASGTTSLYDGVQQVQQEGVVGASYKSFPVSTGDDSFFANTQAKLNSRANGYSSDDAVWQAIKPGSGLAVISSDALPAQGGFGSGNDVFQLKNIKGSDKTFAPFTLDLRNPVSGKTGKVTIIGIISTKIPVYVLDGIYTDAQTYSGVFGQPDLRNDYLRLQSGTNADTYAKNIESSLMTQGVQAFSIQSQINSDEAQSQGFSRIFQGFMGLGLLVGIAAIGVIGFRSVVERRQQIGMLRAIGYQRGTVALSFVLESSFIAIMGILSGVIGAAILSRNLIESDAFGQNAQLHFSIPWVDVIVFVVVAYVFSLLMTYWPSRGASNIVIAEALRYE